MGSSDKISNSDLSTDANEKHVVRQVEDNEKSTTAPPAYDVTTEAPHFDQARTRKLLRKLDFNIVPFLALLYLYVQPLCDKFLFKRN